MKINKKQLKQIIRESIEEMGAGMEEPADALPDAPLSMRQKRVNTATTTGALMDQEQYAEMLKAILLSPKVSAAARRKALVDIFGPKGSSINAIVLQMLKGAQE